MLGVPFHIQHFPIGGAIGTVLVLYQITRGEAFFGFPGDASIKKEERPIEYWAVISIFILGVLLISYLEILYGP